MRRVTRLNLNTKTAAGTGDVGQQQELFTAYRYDALLTDSPLVLVQAEETYRARVIIEQVYAELCPDPAEQPTGRAVPQHVHVVDAVRAGDHPRHERGELHPGVRRSTPAHRHPLIKQLRQPGSLGSVRTGARPAHDTRFGSSNTAVYS